MYAVSHCPIEMMSFCQSFSNYYYFSYDEFHFTLVGSPKFVKNIHGNKKQNIIKAMFIKHHIHLLFHIALLSQFSICNQDFHDLTTGWSERSQILLQDIDISYFRCTFLVNRVLTNIYNMPAVLYAVQQLIHHESCCPWRYVPSLIQRLSVNVVNSWRLTGWPLHSVNNILNLFFYNGPFHGVFTWRPFQNPGHRSRQLYNFPPAKESRHSSTLGNGYASYYYIV